jgi:hypothetical protein
MMEESRPVTAHGCVPASVRCGACCRNNAMRNIEADNGVLYLTVILPVEQALRENAP